MDIDVGKRQSLEKAMLTKWMDYLQKTVGLTISTVKINANGYQAWIQHGSTLPANYDSYFTQVDYPWVRLSFKDQRNVRIVRDFKFPDDERDNKNSES